MSDSDDVSLQADTEGEGPVHPVGEAYAKQICEGLTVGERDEEVRCADCGTRLVPGSPIGAYVVRSSDLGRWEVDLAFCRICEPCELPVESRGDGETLARGWLSPVDNPLKDTDRLVLTLVEILAYRS